MAGYTQTVLGPYSHPDAGWWRNYDAIIRRLCQVRHLQVVWLEVAILDQYEVRVWLDASTCHSIHMGQDAIAVMHFREQMLFFLRHQIRVAVQYGPPPSRTSAVCPPPRTIPCLPDLPVTDAWL